MNAAQTVTAATVHASLWSVIHRPYTYATHAVAWECNVRWGRDALSCRTRLQGVNMPAFRDYGRLALALVLPLTLALSVGCQRPTGEAREWTPEDHGHPAANQIDRSRVPDRSASRDTSPEERRAMAARTLWRVHCSTCHGHGGAGDGTARMPGVQMPDMTTASWQDGVTDEAMVAVITQGRGVMPAFEARIGAEAIRQLVAHIRTMRP